MFVAAVSGAASQHIRAWILQKESDVFLPLKMKAVGGHVRRKFIKQVLLSEPCRRINTPRSGGIKPVCMLQHQGSRGGRL